MSFEDRLSNAMKEVAGSATVASLSFADTIARGRHERRKMMTMVAGVAAALIGLGAMGASALSGGPRQVPRPLPPAGSTEPLTPSPSPSESSRVTPKPDPSEMPSGVDGSPKPPPEDVVDAEGQAIEVGRAWIDAIAAGDLDGAYEMMVNPLSGRARMPRREFEALVAEGASEGLAAYSRAQNPVYGFVPLGGSSGEGTRGVFTVRGTVTREGLTELDAYGLPVAVLAEGAFVDLAPLNEVGITPDRPNAHSDGGGNVVGDSFLARAGIMSQKVVAQVLMAVDDNWKPAGFGAGGPDRVGASARFKGVLPGTHVMTIAVITNDGALYSHSFVIYHEG
ncbi:MAG: hypothetical protein M3124_00235 [Actinomycetota bacterium]|nr:hypothetical protein [Actinomycetota bacterium]